MTAPGPPRLDDLLPLVGAPADGPAVRDRVAADGLAEDAEVPGARFFCGPPLGYEMSIEDGRVVAVFLYAGPQEGYAAWPGELPGGLAAGATRADVLAALGTPEKSGGPSRGGPLDPTGAWDRFLLTPPGGPAGGAVAHFQYELGGDAVRKVTLMPPDAAP